MRSCIGQLPLVGLAEPPWHAPLCTLPLGVVSNYIIDIAQGPGTRDYLVRVLSLIAHSQPSYLPHWVGGETEARRREVSGRGSPSLVRGESRGDRQTVAGGANRRIPPEPSEAAWGCPRRPLAQCQGPPCLCPADGQRAVVQPVPETAAPQWKAVFGPADAGHWVPVHHTVESEAAPDRFHQVGEGLPL